MNTKGTQNQNETLTTGARLRNAREKLGLSQKAVAERLCLKISIVSDIEEDRTPIGLASTFLRGYIRSYAKLVRISETELLPMIEKQAIIQETQIAPIKFFSLGKRRKKHDSWLMTFTWLVLFVVIGLTSAWWWQNYKAQRETISKITNQSSTELISTTKTNNSKHSILMSTSNVLDTDKLQKKASNTSLAVAHVQSTRLTNNMLTSQIKTQNNNNVLFVPSQSNIENILATSDSIASKSASFQSNDTNDTSADSFVNSNEIVISFTADCWLELTDATGKKLFRGLKHKNSKLNLTGKIPYKIKIGAPEAVKIQFQGKSIDLDRFIKANKVAHLTVNSEQSSVQKCNNF